MARKRDIVWEASKAQIVTGEIIPPMFRSHTSAHARLLSEMAERIIELEYKVNQLNNWTTR